jgi:hypothetical protein
LHTVRDYLALPLPSVRIHSLPRFGYNMSCLSTQRDTAVALRIRRILAVLVAAWSLASLVVPAQAQPAAPRHTIVPIMQERLGLTDTQVRGALGALLVFARERLPKPDFDDLAESIPNADRIMQEVKLRGVVTGPLDDMDDYERSLSNLGIGQPLASQVAPAALQALAETGHSRERDILAGVID